MGPLVGTVGLFCMELTAASPFSNHAASRASRVNSCEPRGRRSMLARLGERVKGGIMDE